MGLMMGVLLIIKTKLKDKKGLYIPGKYQEVCRYEDVYNIHNLLLWLGSAYTPLKELKSDYDKLKHLHELTIVREKELLFDLWIGMFKEEKAVMLKEKYHTLSKFINFGLQCIDTRTKLTKYQYEFTWSI